MTLYASSLQDVLQIPSFLLSFDSFFDSDSLITYDGNNASPIQINKPAGVFFHIQIISFTLAIAIFWHIRM